MAPHIQVEGFAAYKFDRVRNVFMENFTERDEVDDPTLILHGRGEQTADPRWAEYMASRIIDAKFVILGESVH